MPRYKCKSLAALDIALSGLPAKMRVEADAGIGVSAKTVGELRKVTTWSENLVITTPQERRPESTVKISKATSATRTSPKLSRARQRPLPNMLIKGLIAAALMLPVPNAYSETQAARHMIMTAAAIALYKMHCRGRIPASAVETVNTTIRKYGESRVVASMVEMGLQREKLGDAAFCVRVEKSLPKK